MEASKQENQHGESQTYIFDNEHNCGLDVEEEHDDDIGKTSDWVSPKTEQQNSCSCLVIYLMLQFQDLSLEHAVLKNNSLHNKFQIKKSEEEVERLFVGHEKHSEHINNMSIMLKNYTVMFNQTIGNLKVDVNDLTKMYENQVKIQRDIQTLIETNNRNTRVKIGKLDTKDIVFQKQIDEIVRTQNSFQQKLSDILMAGSNEEISKQKTNHKVDSIEEHDNDIGNTSDWVSPKTKQKNSCCCSRKIRWKLVIVFFTILTSSCLVSIGLVIYLMLQFHYLSVDLEHAVLRNNSLHNKFQIKNSEEEVERLFVGHEKHSEHINNMSIMLKNYTVMFNQTIGKLKVDVNDLTKMYENQVKIQRDIQTLIETNNRNNTMKIRKLDTKDIKLSGILTAGSSAEIHHQKTNDSQRSVIRNFDLKLRQSVNINFKQKEIV
ncbi:unnamed protein product [Mytilus coruscus]|uniref:Uncharacterized protein n=1 Tax=Mytilus coruscus TaxID=42192 RepID=A0A6J8E0T5_MYTCO|nr:unnamed protein product [Mytilus coruscus]